MSRKARSRALLRNLRKQARKGNLSALERKQLLQQEKRFRKGRGGFRKGLGAGLGAGLGVAAAQFLTSPAFKTLLENRPTFSDLRDRLKKEGVPADKVEDVANTVQDADKDATPAEVVKKVEDRVLTPEAVGMTQEEFDASRARELASADSAENLDDQLEMERMQREELVGPEAPRQPENRIEDIVLPEMEELEEEEDPLVFRDEPVLFSSGMQPMGVANLELPPSDRGELRGPDPAIEQRLAAARESMRLRDNERSSDNMRERAETLERLRREGGFDPFTGEYVDSDRQQRIDAEFDEDFERSSFTDAERAAERENARLDAMDDSAALSAALNALPIPNEGDFEFGDMGGVGQRPALTGPNNPLSRRVNVQDPGLRLPIVDIQEEPEDLYDPQEAGDLARYRLDQMLGAGPLARRRARPIFNEQNEMARAEQNRRSGGSGIPVRQKMGGKNPKMADLMKKVKAKYGIR